MNKITYLIILIILSSCSSKEKKFNANYHYNKALKNIKSGNFTTAHDNLDIIEIDHTYSKYAVKSEILKIFLYYLQKEYQEAIIESDNFIKLRPANKSIDYVHFIKAESQYKISSDYLREQANSKLAKQYYQLVIKRFADSKYFEESNNKITKINARIANYNLDIGRNNLYGNYYISAILRFQNIISNYNDTIYYDEAIYRMIEALYGLGLKDDALNYDKKIENKKWLIEKEKFINTYLSNDHKITN